MAFPLGKNVSKRLGQGGGEKQNKTTFPIFRVSMPGHRALLLHLEETFEFKVEVEGRVQLQ